MGVAVGSIVLRSFLFSKTLEFWKQALVYEICNNK